MDYRLFKKEVLSGTKKIKKWYYWFYDQDGKQVQKVCKNCVTKMQAEEFIQTLPKLQYSKSITISLLTKEMFIPGSMHMKRREQLGKSIKTETICEWRRFLSVINAAFGNVEIDKLSVKDFMSYILQQPKSTSWKNHLINVMKEVYEEAVWYGYIPSVPSLQTFKPKYHKADVLTEDEIQQFAKRENFNNETEYMIFLLMLSAGMRISEARAFRPCQLSPVHNVVYIDGFLDKNSQERKNYCKAGDEDNPRWRVAIVPEKTATELRNFINHSNKDNGDILFTHADAVYRSEYLRKLFNAAIKKAGIEKKGRKITSHSLRYTYVTRMRQLYDSDTVRKMAGHTTLRMNDYYNRPSMLESENALLPVMQKADDFFKS